MAREFVSVMRLYRRAGHPLGYCIKTAWRIAVKGWPF